MARYTKAAHLYLCSRQKALTRMLVDLHKGGLNGRETWVEQRANAPCTAWQYWGVFYLVQKLLQLSPIIFS
ncbi:hypothetical protein [Ligilactobacillus salitolerans]|uniref:hypothetical protein n=1 Tax=Ligilactobacillus salitolerans TaxID=1808352 RepID=UPI0013150DB8|nr:hypothetical protein [Ligilactobacillus salitolerans]